jgi:cytoskeletal protein CcmA (bactofilin family)
MEWDMVFAKEARSHNDRAVASTQGEIQKPLSIFGKLVGHGGLTIFGRVEGEVRASNVVIAEGGQIVGDVSGHVKGTIHANRVKVNSTGVVEGDIFHRALVIEENARFEGTSRRNENENVNSVRAFKSTL